MGGQNGCEAGCVNRRRPPDRAAPTDPPTGRQPVFDRPRRSWQASAALAPAGEPYPARARWLSTGRLGVIKPEWGTKRTCPKCSTRFYDLQNANPVVCISCQHEWLPEPILKSKQPILPVAGTPEVAETKTDEAETESDDGDLDLDDDSSSDDDVLGDVSLDDTDDDVSGVIESPTSDDSDS
nr:TIGR02300 family protein [Rhodothalassium salexigens]